MQKVSLTNKVFTENPLLDEIVYNARQIATGVIVKDSDKADKEETLESLQNGDILIAINSGTIHFDNFYYDRDLLSKYYMSNVIINQYAMDNSLIPESDKPALLKIAIDTFLENFEEQNNYYRMLHGLPAYGKMYDDEHAWEGLWIDQTAINDIGITSIEYIAPVKMGQDYVPIHELNLATKNILYETGTCENIVNDSDTLGSWNLTKDDVLYLMHIGDREVDYYDARSADRFALLYCPRSDAEEVRRRFKELYEANRLYLLYTMYSPAYKYRSDYYDNFMMIFLVIQTIIDMVIELPEYIIRRDIFDTRTCKYIFESNGVRYFKDIPLKYQVSLVKNLNKLIKFKSTDKCIVDIISIFGVENIEVFRYYIMKDRNVANEPGEDPIYFNNMKTVTDSMGNTTTSEDNIKNYELRFIKVPMLGKYDEHIRTDSKIYSYDTIIESDAYWIGDREYDIVEEDIKNLDFTVLRSKYYSIEAVIDLAKRNFELTYFTNMLLYHNVDESLLTVSLPNVSTAKKFEIIDVILTLYSLSYIYYGVEDTILDSRAKAAQILGFNMEADLSTLSSWLYENHIELTLKDLKVDTFSVPENGKIYSFNELQDMFLANKDCYDHIRSVLRDPPSKLIYNIYKYLEKSLLTMNRNMEYFLVGDNPVVDEYKELGYKTKFVNIPIPDKYTNIDDYWRDRKWFIDSIDENTLCFDMDANFDENHLFNLYIKQNDDITNVGTAQMAYTYKEFLRYKDSTLYNFIYQILSIRSVENRQEACINAIQAITSYLKDYIDQDIVNLDTAFSGLPSISLDFIKKYIEEVVDFFKSFKIFTHGSSIIYMIDDKFDNYVQLVEGVLFKYLFDKSELIRVEDALGGKVEQLYGLLVNRGNGLASKLSSTERLDIIDKVWFEISTWLKKNYEEYYNSDNYTQSDMRIRDYAERFSAYTVTDKAMEEKYISQLETYAVDAILGVLVDMVKEERVEVSEGISLAMSHELSDYYNEWISDLLAIMVSKSLDDKVHIQDDISRSDFYEFYTKFISTDKHTLNQVSFDKSTSLDIKDTYYSIITQNFPEHQFDE